MATFFGITNCAFYNRRPEGDTTWFLTELERNAALVALRDRAVANGLNEGSSRAGIYPVRKEIRSKKAAQAFADEIEFSA